jgi:hypothetical protein
MLPVRRDQRAVPAAPEKDPESLTLIISSPSRGLNQVLVGEVDLTKFRTGIYNTLQFPIPDKVRTALGGATFKDLTFEFKLASPPTDLLPSGDAAAIRQFLFDNLRVHSVPLVKATTGTKPPAGFGGPAVNLEAIGSTPVTQAFPIGAVQVPDSFHLTEGTAGTTSVTLGLGHDGSPAFTCTYNPDSSDTSRQSYTVKSCTGGIQAGDIVSANFAQLAIGGGSSSMKLRVQLARNPVGNLLGSGIIPPMPTFWGNFNTCVPAPATGKVQTTSASCANQVAQVNQIVTDYFNKVHQFNVAPNWIATPTPERALRHGNGLPVPKTIQPPHHIAPLDGPQVNDVPFDESGHVNQGGDFDAFWELKGDFNTNDDPSTGSGATHFDATLSGNVVLFGRDFTIASLQATADTTTGSSPSATGSAHLFVVVGINPTDGSEIMFEVPGGGSVDASTGFNFKISDTREINLIQARAWIFVVEAGVSISAGVNTSGTLAATGFNLSVEPFVDMGAHVFGGVDVGIASGGVDGRIDLLKVSTPLTAQAGLLINANPQSCSLTLNFALNGTVTISSLGGEIDLVASLGICPFCDTASYTLVSWDPLFSTTQTLFSVPATTLAAVPLPAALCPMPPLNITIKTPGATVSEILPQPLFADANAAFGTVSCKWGGFLPGDAPTSTQLCRGAQVPFGNLGPRTLTVNAVNTVTDRFGRQFTASASASKNIDVVNLPPGDYIMGTNPAPEQVCAPSFGCTIPQAPFTGQTLTILVPAFPAGIQISGEVIPSAGTTTTWTATDSSGKTTTIPPTICLPKLCGSLGGDPDVVSVNWSVPKADVYTITMTTTNTSGKVVGNASMTANVPNPRIR